MQGTVLILDGVATSRIMLRVQLSAAYYRVVQATALAGVAELVRRTRPDVIACAMNLPDGDAITLRQRLRHDPDLDAIPVIAITEENDRHARIRALEAGIDDVISRPLDDPLLMARVRNLVRSRNNAEVQVLREATGHPLGFSEPAPKQINSGVPLQPSLAADESEEDSLDTPQDARKVTPRDFGGKIQLVKDKKK